jgi:hypothetical protein
MINDYSIHDTTDMYINMRQVTGTCTASSLTYRHGAFQNIQNSKNERLCKSLRLSHVKATS